MKKRLFFFYGVQCSNLPKELNKYLLLEPTSAFRVTPTSFKIMTLRFVYHHYTMVPLDEQNIEPVCNRPIQTTEQSYVDCIKQINQLKDVKTAQGH